MNCKKCQSELEYHDSVELWYCHVCEKYLDFEIHLCDECKNEFAICKSNPEFGNGHGNDNVIECDSFKH